MTETKQNWEEEFDEKFPSIDIIAESEKLEAWIGKPQTATEAVVRDQDIRRKIATRSEVSKFIHKVRTEAILEERKRIEVEANKLLSSEVYWDGMTFVEQSIVGGNILINNGIKKILKIINNKNI